MGLVALFGWLVLLVISGILLFLAYSNWRVKRKCLANGFPYVGVNLSVLFRFMSGSITLPEMELTLYKQCVKTGDKIVGFNDMFVNLAYYITDLDLTRLIYIKDFDHFVDRRKFGTSEINKDDLFLKMLISLEGDHWKGVRAKLSPTFTTGKIRRMFGIFEKSSEKMCDYLRTCIGKDGGETDICEAYSKYAMDVIASCAFGIESKAFEGKIGELSEFEKMAQLLQFKISPLIFIKIIFFTIATRLATKMGLTPFDTRPQKYFRHVIKSVMKQRREGGERKEDFLQLMMDAQEGLLKESKESLEVMSGTEEGSGIGTTVFDSPKITLDDDDIAANCILFILAGFDTTQSLLIFAAYMLALEPEVQEKLLEEVTAVMDKNGGKLEYDEVHQMQYLDLFINETLRYFPPASRTERLCTKDYQVPGTDLVIEKGSMVSMSVYGMHRNPKYYTDPEKFDPERFLPERKSGRHPYSFSPFGHGSRNCIGMRFALTEVKTIIATLVYNFKLEPGKKTDIPMKFQNNASLKPANGMWLKISPRRKDA